MTSKSDDMDNIRQAKQDLIEAYGHLKWFRGAGIAPSESGASLRLNVDPTADIDENDLPNQFHGFPVVVVYIGTYKPR